MTLKIINLSDRYENLFRSTLRIRRIEERIASIYASDRIQSPIHLSIGQEAVSVGVCAELSKEDLAFGTYRGHALYLAKGGDLRLMMAELFGKVTGFAKGKAGSMHLADSAVGVMGCSAIVGSTIPHATGAGLAAKIAGNDQVVAVFFGESATNQGVFHECLNFATLHRLPVLFVCEDNQMAIHTLNADITGYSLRELVSAYSIKYAAVENGMDFINIANRAQSSIARIRHGEGPEFLHVHTCRYVQHVGPGTDVGFGVRSEALINKWMAKDPLYLADDLVKKFISEINAEIDEAIDFADSSDFPGASQLLADIS